MGRLAEGLECRREVIEAGQCQLGNALVYLDLVRERVLSAERYTPKGLLEPAVEDLLSMEILIVRAQQQFQKVGKMVTA